MLRPPFSCYYSANLGYELWFVSPSCVLARVPETMRRHSWSQVPLLERTAHRVVHAHPHPSAGRWRRSPCPRSFGRMRALTSRAHHQDRAGSRDLSRGLEWCASPYPGSRAHVCSPCVRAATVATGDAAKSTAVRSLGEITSRAGNFSTYEVWMSVAGKDTSSPMCRNSTYDGRLCVRGEGGRFKLDRPCARVATHPAHCRDWRAISQS